MEAVTPRLWNEVPECEKTALSMQAAKLHAVLRFPSGLPQYATWGSDTNYTYNQFEEGGIPPVHLLFCS